ncbi:MAG: threonine/serine exporter family protein [Coriobacteriales bacterium]|jgi:uncharacterized membrane protein YjjP (DUF1212 family)|nr:threonine/serine exporter family protein [Coriobacteriales bacterium]
MEQTQLEQDKVLLLATTAGEMLLKNGAEIYRADEAVNRICAACNISFVETFTTPSAIILSVGNDSTSARIGTVVKRINNRVIDLEKISLITHFIHKFVSKNMSVDEGLEALKNIEASKSFSLFVRMLAIIPTSFFLAMLNGSDLIGGLCAIFVGIISYALSLGIERLRINRFISIFISCTVAAGISLVLFSLGLGSSLSAIIVGAIIVFLPGVAITNAVRDLLAGDMLSGVARMAEACLTAIAIAGGVGILLQMTPQIATVIGANALRPEAITIWPVPLQFIFAALGTIGIAIIVNIPRRYLVLVAVTSGCGWLAYTLALNNITAASTLMGGLGTKPLACFVGSCTIALIAELCTRATRDAATVFIIPSIFPFVPGTGMLNTILRLLEDKVDAAIHTGLETAFISGCIAVALLVIISLTRVVRMGFSWIKEHVGRTAKV